MAKKADISSKRLISLSPDPWVKWIAQMPDLEARAILDAEFQWVSREGDVLIKAYSRELGEFLILNEIQLRYQANLPRRMRAYAALAEEKYELPVYPVLVNLLEASTDTIRSSFESNFAGIRAIQDYRVINLWEVDVEIVFEQNLSTLLPFVPILKGGGNEAIIRQALQKMRSQEQPEELESMLAFFATYVLDSKVIQKILRFDMAVLEQSPLYREIVERSEQRGIEIGEQRGIEIGEQRGIEIGEQRGIERGIDLAKQEVALNMLRMGMAIAQVSEATGLTIEQLTQLRDESSTSQ